VTEPTTAAPPNPASRPLPPDPVKYDDPRNVMARRRGLEQPYITGGEDPELEQTLAEERPYVRILVWMVAVIVIGGFVLGFIGAILGVPIT
jgi:hypothetical protein